MSTVISTQDTYDLANRSQRDEFLGKFFIAAEMACEGSIGRAFMAAKLPYGWRPKGDGRSAAMRRFSAAEGKLIEAMYEYDEARSAALLA